MQTSTQVKTVTTRVIELTREEVEQAVLLHLECDLNDAVEFDISSGGYLRGAKVITVTKTKSHE